MQPSKLCDARLLPVWNLQRSFRLDRAETIAKAKLKRPEMGFPGVISVYELPSPGGGEGFRAILDGQHRVARRPTRAIMIPPVPTSNPLRRSLCLCIRA